MKVKRVLRFYFSAESLERAFDNIIINSAFRSADCCGAGDYTEKILSLIEEKQELARLWGYLDGVIGELAEGERGVLDYYAGLRCGIKRLGDEKRKEIKRAVMKFKRRARRLESFTSALRLAGKYYCLLG